MLRESLTVKKFKEAKDRICDRLTSWLEKQIDKEPEGGFAFKLLCVKEE